eukprot:maker-scaffold684_size112211-snap-gene-0.13 protein:Tk06442 transcript:maker-scaffold684_size112211-snap-gene-0.13-mRNA-1 annotation:"hypothetical protein LOTGIDRAFT_188589"
MTCGSTSKTVSLSPIEVEMKSGPLLLDWTDQSMSEWVLMKFKLFWLNGSDPLWQRPGLVCLYRNEWKQFTMEHIESKGLYIDDLQKLRAMDPELTEQTENLKTECGSFVTHIGDFQRMTDGFIQISDDVSKEVEKEKLAALGARNQLKSITKAREQEQQQLHALVMEKKMSLERLRLQYESLQKVQVEQEEFIDQIILQQ